MACQSGYFATEVSFRATKQFLVWCVNRADMQVGQVVSNVAALFILTKESEVDFTIAYMHLVGLIAVTNGHEEHFTIEGRHRCLRTLRCGRYQSVREICCRRNIFLRSPLDGNVHAERVCRGFVG